MPARGCRVSAINYHRLEIAIEHHNLAMKWQVSAVPIKTMVIFQFLNLFLWGKCWKTIRFDNMPLRGCHQVPTWSWCGTSQSDNEMAGLHFSNKTIAILLINLFLREKGWKTLRCDNMPQWVSLGLVHCATLTSFARSRKTKRKWGFKFKTWILV